MSSGMEFSSPPSAGLESSPSYSQPSSNLPPKQKPTTQKSKPINPANKNDPKRGKWQYEYYEKKFKKIEEQLAIQRILSSGKGIGIKGASFGLDMGKGFGTTLKNRQSIIVPGAAESGKSRMWSKNNFIKLSNKLSKKHTLIFIGADNEKYLIKEIIDKINLFGDLEKEIYEANLYTYRNNNINNNINNLFL